MEEKLLPLLLVVPSLQVYGKRALREMSCDDHVISNGGQVESSSRPGLYSDFLKSSDLLVEGVRGEFRS